MAERISSAFARIRAGFPARCGRPSVRVGRCLAPSRSLPRHGAPAEDRRQQHDLSHEDDPVDVDRRYPRDIGTLDDEGTRRPCIEADSGPTRLAGVLTATAAPAYF